MKYLRMSRSNSLTLFAVLGMVFVSQAVAATYSFGWQHWVGGGRDSQDWHADNTGTHQWVKETCRADAFMHPGGNFTVEIRRNRGSFQPDVSLGTQQFACNDSDAAAEYYSDGGGDHHFRFPSVDVGFIGINGTGHVNHP